MSKDVEVMILGSLLHNKDYSTKVLPFTKERLFESESVSALTKIALQYHDKYSDLPSEEAFLVEVNNQKGLSENAYQDAKAIVTKIFSQDFSQKLSTQNVQWLLDKTEKYFKDRSCFLAIVESMSIIDGENKKLTREAIPDILKDALNISFDIDVGHDYIEDAEKRFDFYHAIEERIPFALKELNRYTNGGLPRKTLMIPVAPTGVGKSLFMTDWSAYLITQGYNVLYVTLELAEERIAERVDAKLFDLEIQQLKELPKSSFDKKINGLKNKTLGKLIVNEYSPGTFNANHLRFLLQELKNKRGFAPDIIMIDYLNLMASYRMKDNSNSYSYIKSIAEEIRGVGMEHNCAIVAPTQTNRSGAQSSDYSSTDVSESFGTIMTADIAIGFISTPELEALSQMRGKILKNRFGRPDGSFLMGVNRAKMSLYDCDLPINDTQLSTNKTHSKVEPKKPQGFTFED